MQDKRDELYNNLIKSGKVSEGQIGTIDQFKSSVKDEATAKKFHENLMGAGFSADEIGDSDVFYGAISSDFQQPKVAPVQTGTIQQPSQISHQSVQAPPPSKKDVEIFGGIPYSEYQNLPGKERLQVYSKWQGDKNREAQAKLRGSNNNQVESLYADVNKEIESLSASEKVEAPAGAGFIPASARGAAQRYGNAQNKEKQDKYTMLESAKGLLENSQKIIAEAGKKGDTNFFGGAGRGFRDKAFNLDTWAMGVTDLYKNKFIQNASEKADKGEELTHEEQRLLDAATVNMVSQALFSSDLGRGYKAGGVTAESLPFMLEMIANPAATAGKGVGNAILRYGVKKFGAKAAEKVTGTVAKKLLGNVAKASTRVAGDVLAAGAMTATSGIARTAADAVSRNTGQVTYGIDKEGNAEYSGMEGGVSGVEAAYKSFAGNTIENFSEMFGGYFGALGGVMGKTRPMQALKASKVGEAFSKINSSDWAKTVAEFEKKTNYNGTFGEYGEEVVGTVLNSIFTWDQSLGDLVDVDQQIDTFLGVSLMGGFMSSVKALGYRTPKYEAEKNLRKAETNVASYFGDDWVGIRSTLEEADVEDRTAYLSSVLSSEMNVGEKKAMFEYVSKLTTRDAIKAGDEKLAEEGVDLNDGIAQNKASVYNGYNEAAKKALKSLPIEAIEEIDQQIEGGVDGDQLHQYIADKGLPENQSDDLLDYSVAKQDFNDYINGVQSRIDSEKANVRQQMESVSNPDMGATVRVKSVVSETPIHVVGGKLVFDEQGFVDEKQSDEVVYYIDEAGERKMAAPSMFESLIDITPTEELIAQAEADVENGIITQEDLELSPLEVGQSVYGPDGMPGEVIRFTAEGDPIVLSDAGEQVFKKEELVSGIRSDEANVKKGTENEVKVGENAEGIQNEGEKSDIVPAAVEVDAEALPGEEILPAAAVESEDAESRIPVDEKGNLLYHRSPVDTTLESVRSYGLDESETDEFVSAQRTDASKRLDKLQKGKPKVGTNLAKYQSEKKVWENSLADAQAQSDYWDEVETQVQATRVQPGDATAAAINSMGDPVNGGEFASMMLGGGKLPVLFDDYKRETGFSNQDAKGMFGLFASKENGGMSIEQVGEKLMEMDAANGTHFFDQTDANAGRNAVLDVLSSSRTRGDLFGYIKGNRERMAEQERKAEYDAYEGWVNDLKHMSVSDYEADEETFDSRTKEFVASYNFDEINGNIADDLTKEENDRRTEEPGIESISRGTTENIQGELNQGQGSGSIEQPEGSGTIEESERGRQGGSEESIISGADVVGSKQSDGEDLILYHGSPYRFDVFDEKEIGTGEGASKGMVGINLSETSGMDRSPFFANIRSKDAPLHLGVPKPTSKEIIPTVYTVEGSGLKLYNSPKAKGLNKEALIEQGYDGVRIGSPSQITVFPESIHKLSVAKKSGIIDFIKEHPEVEKWRDWTVDKSLYPEIFEKEALAPIVDAADAGEFQKEEQTEEREIPFASPEHVDSESIFDNAERIDESQRAVQEQSIEVPGSTGVTPFFAVPEIKPDEDVLGYAERVVKSKELHDEQSKVNTDPTDAQKEAGNYKMGHVKIGGHDVTIENPKGSVRRGVGSDGKAWETPMNNTYGYFRGTKGKDGDHIDTFLGENLNPENVYVVDQVNEDGSFDEHKVMYGFDSAEDARSAYLSNYEEGWKGLGKITGVPRDVFDAWLGSGTKKQKPFAEYKVIIDEISEKNGDGIGPRLAGAALRGKGDISEKYYVGKDYELSEGNSFYLRFTDAPHLDIKHGTSRWYDSSLSDEDAINRGYQKDQNAGWFWEHSGLSGHYIDAESLDDAIRAVEGKTWWFRNSKEDSWSIFEDDGDRYVVQDTPEGNTFAPLKVVYSRFIEGSITENERVNEIEPNRDNGKEMRAENENPVPAIINEEYHSEDGNSILYTHSRNLPSKKGEFCHVERVFTESGAFSFTGRGKIESADDVAYIFKELENASVENSFAVLVKNNKPTIIHLGMGSFVSTAANIASIKAAYSAIGADSIYFVHNHPSGNLKCSRQDVAILNGLSEMFESEDVIVQDGIIINTTSGKYGTFNLKGYVEAAKRPNNQDELPLKLYAFDRLVFSKDYDASNLSKIMSSEDIASLVSSQRLGERDKVSYMILDNANHVLGNIHTEFSSIKKNESDLADEIARNVIRFGGTLAAVYGDFDMKEFSPGALNSKIKRLSAGNVRLLDCVSVDGDNTRSAVDDNLMEPKENYGFDEMTDNEIEKLQSSANEFASLFMVDDVVYVLGHGEFVEKLKENGIESVNGVAVNLYDGNILVDASYCEDENAMKKYITHEIFHTFVHDYLSVDEVETVGVLIGEDKLSELTPGYETEDTYGKVNELIAVIGSSLHTVGKLQELLNGQISSNDLTLWIDAKLKKIPKDIVPLVGKVLNTIENGRQQEKTSHFEKGIPGLLGKESDIPRGGQSDREPVDSRRTISERGAGKEGSERRGGAGEVIRDSIRHEAQALAEKLRAVVRVVDEVEEIVDGNPNLQQRKRASKGWFDPSTGEVVIVIPNAASVEDAQATILHEVVAHKGLRDMFGVDFGDFLDDVFKNASDDIRLKIMNMANGYDGNHRVATEEYLAELAESGFKNEQDRSIWNKIKDSFIAMLRKIGIRIELTDADLRSILKKSYDNLERGGISELDNDFEEDGTPSDEMLFRDSEGESILRHVEEDRRSITQVIDAIRRINEIKKNELSERTWGTKIAEGLFDDAFKLKMLQDSVEAERGGALPGYMNPYQYITSIPKRNEYEVEEFNEQYMRPIYKEMRAMKDAGASEKGIYAYLYAKSGLERNEKMRTKAMMEYIDAIDDEGIRSTLLSESSGITISEMYFSHENAEKKKMSLLSRDYSGLTELREIIFDEDSNKGEDRIQEWVDEFENKYETDNLWASINLATKATLENEFRTGKIDKATKKKIEGMYDYYLPLRKWEGEQAGDVWEYTNGDQREGIGSVVKKAFGRKSLAGNPIVNIGLMGQQSIHSGNRNELKQMFLSMARNNPNEAYAVSPLWIKNIGTEGSEDWMETAPEWDDNPDVFAENVERFDEEMAVLQKEGRAKQKYTRGSVGMPITKIEANEHQVIVSEAGKRYIVYVNSDPAIARAINGIGGKAYSVQDGKALSNDFVQKIIRGNGMIMRTMGQSFTTWNPMFILANGQRDIMNALLVASVKEGKEYAGEMAKNMFSPSVHGTIMRAVLGKADMNNPIDKLFAEYESNGGETGFSELFKDSDFEKQIKKELNKKKVNPMDVVHLYLNNVEKLNRWAENVSRFSTYKASRDSGRDVYRSVYDAKEITVNFNRKGTGACGGNFLRLIYIFSGAGLQATYQIGRLSINRKTRKKAAVLMTSVAVAGYLIPLMNNMLLGGDGDDIEDGYDFKPEYERKSNIMTRIGKGKFAKLSIPQELRPFWNIGETLYQLTRGNIDTWEASTGIVKGFAGVMPFDPFGSSGLVPTVLQPIDQVRNNENFFGGKIYKEETRYNKHLPQWRRSFRNTSPIAVGLSKWLNDATGGDEATQGKIDINPGGMESLVEGYFGGAVKFINNMAKTTKGVTKAIDGDSSFLETRNIPFVSSFYTDSSNPISKEVERLYWDYINLSERLGTREREYRKLMEEHPEKILYFQDKLMELKESKDYERKKVIDGYNSTISNMTELVNRDILDGKSKTVVLKQIKDLKKNMLNEINKIK